MTDDDWQRINRLESAVELLARVVLVLADTSDVGSSLDRDMLESVARGRWFND